jgi:hypothetical protein
MSLSVLSNVFIIFYRGIIPLAPSSQAVRDAAVTLSSTSTIRRAFGGE